MPHNLEIRFIKFIQSIFFTDNYNILDNTAKFISSRKYKKYFLILYLIYLLFNFNTYTEFLDIPKFYLFSHLSRFVNIKIKLFFMRKRPYVSYPDILVLEKTKEKKKNTLSLPSNSIQTSLIFYSFLINRININIVTKILILFIIVILTSLAKINRGLHYPSDILLSIIIYLFLFRLYQFLLFTVLIN